MSAVCTRLIAFAGATVRDPYSVDDPQFSLVQGRVGVLLDPTRTELGPAPLAAIPDFWDVLVYPRFDKTGYVILYEAEMQDDTSIIVKRDLFGPNDFGHTWAGWPIPGDDVEVLSGGVGVMPTTLLTEGEQKALAYMKKRKEK